MLARAGHGEGRSQAYLPNCHPFFNVPPDAPRTVMPPTFEKNASQEAGLSPEVKYCLITLMQDWNFS